MSATESLPIRYSVTDVGLATMAAQYEVLEAGTKDGYEQVRMAVRHCVATRRDVEATRKELKADALAYGRKVDAEAKRITSRIAEIEAPLVAKKKVVDDAKAEEKARQEREAEEKRIREVEAKIESNRKEVERRQKAEDERLAAERAKLEAERLEFERQQVADAEAARHREAKAAADEAVRRRELEEREATVEAERQRVAAAKAAREAEARAARLAPDKDKLQAYAQSLLEVPTPDVRESEAKANLQWALDGLTVIRQQIIEWTRRAT